MIDLEERVAELSASHAFIENHQFYGTIVQRYKKRGTSVMSGREVMSITTWEQHNRVIYQLEENLLGELFLYELDLLPQKQLLSFLLNTKTGA